jgi:hypothetical protein
MTIGRSLALTLAMVLALPPAARASQFEGTDLAVDQDGFYWLMRDQGQLLVLTSAGAFGDDFGGVELQLNTNFASLGLALGFRYDHLLVGRGDEARTMEGGEVELALQWRPRLLSDHRASYISADLHADLGFIAGGLRVSGESRWRGAIYVGAGVDLPIPLLAVPIEDDDRHVPPAMDLQLVLALQYRYMIIQAPEDAPTHELLLGVGLRTVL